MTSELEERSNRLANELSRLQDLKEKGVVGAKRDYALTLTAYLDTQKEMKRGMQTET